MQSAGRRNIPGKEPRISKFKKSPEAQTGLVFSRNTKDSQHGWSIRSNGGMTEARRKRDGLEEEPVSLQIGQRV